MSAANIQIPGADNLTLQHANDLEDVKHRFVLLMNEWIRHGFEDKAIEMRQRLRDCDEPLLLMIVGQGKAGKSSLVNALLGISIAPTARIPKTWKVDIYQSAYGNAQEAELYWRSNLDKPSVASIEEAQAICEREEEQARTAQRGGDQLYQSDLCQVRWKLSPPWMPLGIALVDTPGYAQDRFDLVAENTRLYGSNGIEFTHADPFQYYYGRSNGVLWCFPAHHLQNRETLSALETVRNVKKRIVGVLTHMDRVPEDRRDEVLSEAQRLYGDFITEWVCCATAGKDHLLQQHSMNDLRQLVEREFWIGCRDLKSETMREALEEETDAFLKAMEGMMTCYITNAGIRADFLFELRRQILEHFSRTEAAVGDIWTKATDTADRKLEAMWSESGGNTAVFNGLVSNRALDVHDIDLQVSRELGRLDGEVTNGCKNALGQLSWETIRVGQQTVELFQETAVFIGIESAFQNATGSYSPGVVGDEGIGLGIGAGVAAAAIGAIALGPIGLVAGLIGFFVNEMTKQSRCIEKARHSIAEFCINNAAIAKQSLVDAQANIISVIPGSFHNGRWAERTKAMAREKRAE